MFFNKEKQNIIIPKNIIVSKSLLTESYVK